MYNFKLLLTGLLLLSVNLVAQESAVIDFLSRIESNNQSLKAYRSYLEKESLQLKTTNNLPDPQLSGYYLPWGEHNTPDYTEYELSQRFEFPTVYRARDKLIDRQLEQLKFNYQQERQQILVEAWQYLIDAIYLEQALVLAERRENLAAEIYGQAQSRFDQGQAGILELNKTRLTSLEQEFVTEDLENQLDQVLEKIIVLNGGQDIELNPLNLENSLSLPPFDSLWQQRLNNDADLLSLEANQAVANQRINLEKNKWWPDITAGFNSQGFPGSVYSGIYGGLSIPLWNNRNQVKVAVAAFDYARQYYNAEVLREKTALSNLYQRYQVQLQKYQAYQEALSQLESENLLLTSYELGEISFLEYYLETRFYRDAENRVLEIKMKLNKMKSELLKHQL